MASDISFMQYMRAHGNTPGPTQRPLLTGALSGLFAEIPSGLLLYWSGALSSIEKYFFWDTRLILAADGALMIFSGILYAWIFKRAANDCKGGWLFGISFGFLLWMFAPVTLWQIITNQPIAVGHAAMGLFGSRIVFGFFLGLLFPRVHALVQRRLSEALNKPQPSGELKTTK